MRYIDVGMYSAKVDDADYERLSAFTWHPRVDRRRNGSISTIYAQRNITVDGRRTISQMHREITGAVHPDEVDHKDHDGLNNQKENLRVVTKSLNQRNARMRCDNSTGVTGVYTHFGRFRAIIQADKRRINLGVFVTLEEASNARKEAEHALAFLRGLPRHGLREPSARRHYHLRPRRRLDRQALHLRRHREMRAHSRR